MILIVDDDPAVRLSLKLLLSRNGFRDYFSHFTQRGYGNRTHRDSGAGDA